MIEDYYRAIQALRIKEEKTKKVEVPMAKVEKIRFKETKWPQSNDEDMLNLEGQVNDSVGQ